MPERRPVTRAQLQRALAVNALTKPVNVAVPSAMVVVALVLGATWLVIGAVLTYLVLAGMTFFDGSEAERVGDRVYGRARPAVGPGAADPAAMAPPIAAQLERAVAAQKRIEDTVERSDLNLADVGREADGLLAALRSIAGRAQRVYEYLSTQDVDEVERRMEELRGQDERSAVLAALRQQLDALTQLQRQLDRFYSEMESIVAALETVNAELVRMSVVSEDVDPGRVTAQVRGLREQVDALSAGLKEAYAETDAPALPS